MLHRRFQVASDPAVTVVLTTAGLACCSIEVDAAVHAGLLVPEQDPEPASDGAGRDAATVLVVAGTITSALEPALEAELGRLPSDTKVLAFGACAISGGPYWDSPVVSQGMPDVAVAAYVPGCPPRPQQLVDAILGLAGGAA